MDDLNLMANSVQDTKSLLDRSCTALKWARMEFRPDKSRCIVVKKGSVLKETPFSTGVGKGSTIPSIHSNPIKALGRIVNGELNDKRSVSDIREKLEKGLRTIANSKQNGKAKIWILSHLLIPQIRWPLMIYEVPLKAGIELEKRVSFFIRKWLRLPISITNVALYSKISPCALPLVSLTSVLRSSKVSAYLQLRESKDALISTLGPKLRAGKFDVEKEVQMAEAELKFKDMVGAPVARDPPQIGSSRQSSTKPGLGLNERQKTPNKDSAEYRRQVNKVAGDIHEEEYMRKAVACSVQCNWTRWVDYIHNDLSWSKVVKMPMNLLSFCINATYDTLPTPVNLKRWKIPDSDGLCTLCPENEEIRGTTAHILGACKSKEAKDRHSWRHDSVLYEVIAQIRAVASNPANRRKETKKQSTTFVRQGSTASNSSQKAKSPAGILSQASDWLLLADFKNLETVPPCIAKTTLRPDIVFYSVAKKQVVMIELTCPCEENFVAWQAEKLKRYKELKSEMEKNRWKVNLFAIEVGARGYCSTSVRSCLHALGFSAKKLKEALQKFGRIALECSFHIWLCRNQKEWSFDDEHPWKDWANPVKICEPLVESAQKTPEKSGPHSVVGMPKQSVDPTCGTREYNQKNSRRKDVRVAPTQEKFPRRNKARSQEKSGVLAGKTSKPSIPSSALPKERKSSGQKFPPPPNVYRSSYSTPVQRRVTCKEQRPLGLQNKGATCYLNGLLQALLVVPAFWQPFAELTLDKQFSMVKKLLDTLTSMERVNKAVKGGAKVETRSLLEELQVTKRNSGDKNFKWNAQHDPAEILGIIVRNLQDALDWDEIDLKPHTHFTCKNCKKVSYSPAQDQPEPFLILNPEIEMQKCINAYRYKRYVGRQCPHCESTNVVIKNRFHRAPEVLVVQLNRSKPSGKKDQTEVKKSGDILFGKESALEKYDLKAVLCHQGENTETGHYTTYAKHGNIWYHFNDHSVFKLPQGTISTCLKSKIAYMYVYEKLIRPPN